jgi:hypothetical protein
VPLELQHLLGAAALTGGGLGAALLAGAAVFYLLQEQYLQHHIY